MSDIPHGQLADSEWNDAASYLYVLDKYGSDFAQGYRDAYLFNGYSPVRHYKEGSRQKEEYRRGRRYAYETLDTVYAAKMADDSYRIVEANGMGDAWNYLSCGERNDPVRMVPILITPEERSRIGYGCEFRRRLYERGLPPETLPGNIRAQKTRLRLKPDPAFKREAIAPRQRFLVMRRDGYKCKICGRTGEDSPLVIDHIYPVSRGGTNEINNLQTLCELCNSGKGNLPL